MGEWMDGYVYSRLGLKIEKYWFRSKYIFIFFKGVCFFRVYGRVRRMIKVVFVVMLWWCWYFIVDLFVGVKWVKKIGLVLFVWEVVDYCV